MEKILPRFLVRVADRLVPVVCIGCDGIRPRSMPAACPRCLPHILPYRGSARALAPEVDFFHATALFEGPLRKILLAFKYQRRTGALPFLSNRLIKTFPRSLNDIDAVIPVPMSFWRRLRRGVNHAALLAEEIGRRIGKPVITRGLSHRWGPSQTRLSRPARMENATRRFRLARPGALRELKTVLLVDDVCTTGATLKRCAHLLKEAGVGRVWAAVVARKA